MSLRRSDRRARLGRLGTAGPRAAVLAAALACTLALAPLLLTSCARYAQGAYHTVQPGENLYRIGLRYGVAPEAIAEANGIDDVTTLEVGRRLWIPKSSGRSADRRRPGSRQLDHRQTIDRKAAQQARRDARREAERSGDLRFSWPVRGARVTSRFGRRNGRSHEGIDIGASRGTRVHAAESGKVIHSGWLGDYGKVVIVKHAGHYRSVYAHAHRLHVRKGDFVEKGQRIAEVGRTGNATGPHLHFEIRVRETPRDPMLYLP